MTTKTYAVLNANAVGPNLLLDPSNLQITTGAISSGANMVLGGDPALGTTPTVTLTGTGGIYAMATPYSSSIGYSIDLVSDPANMLGTAPSGFTAGL